MGERTDIDGKQLTAFEVAEHYAMIDGAHHKQWVIDQMLRSILGDVGYAAWRKAYDEDSRATGYSEWDEGIAP